MTTLPLKYVARANDRVELTLMGDDGRSLTAEVSTTSLREACAAILASVGHDDNTWRAVAGPVLAKRGVSISQILGPSKEFHVSRARQAVCWELSRVRDASGERRWTNMAIGRFLGITHGCVSKAIKGHAARNHLEAA